MSVWLRRHAPTLRTTRWACQCGLHADDQGAISTKPLETAIALAAGLALADAAVVTLALPQVLVELDTTVEGVAAVIGVYTAVLALALPLSAALHGPTTGTAGALLFAAASIGCASADSLELLLAMRALQALGGAAMLAARVRRARRRRLRAPALGRRGGRRHRGRTGARRTADRAVRLAGDLHRAGAGRAGRGAGAARRSMSRPCATRCRARRATCSRASPSRCSRVR